MIPVTPLCRSVLHWIKGSASSQLIVKMDIAKINIKDAFLQTETAGGARMVVLWNKKNLPMLVLLSEVLVMVCASTMLRTLLHHQLVSQAQ